MRRVIFAASLLLGCPTEEPSPGAADDEPRYEIDSYFGQFLLQGLYAAMKPQHEANLAREEAQLKSVREAGCPPLEISIDGEKTEFPYAFAVIEEQTQQLRITVRDQDVMTCNGARLPDGWMRMSLYSDDDGWRPPKSVEAESIELGYRIESGNFTSMRWRSGFGRVHPVMLSGSLSGDTVEVCIPERHTITVDAESADAPQQTLSVKGLIRAQRCGTASSVADWHAGKVDCDGFNAQEAGVSLDVDIFVDDETAHGVVGYRSADGITCEDLASHPTPLFSAEKWVVSEDDEKPRGRAISFSTNEGHRIHGELAGAIVSPMEPNTDGALCLHHPLYWYEEGRLGFVRGKLAPKKCPSP